MMRLSKKGDKNVPIFGAMFRGGLCMDGLPSAGITVDGNDATGKIHSGINNARYKDQVKIIMLDGITFGGFNVVDIGRLHEETGMR